MDRDGGATVQGHGRATTETDVTGEATSGGGFRARMARLHRRLHANPVTGLITKVVVTVVGAAVVALGVVMSGPGIPGPGLVVILLGLAILSTEWTWAERLLRWGRRKAHEAAERARALDPAERRRRLLLTGLVVLLLGAALVAYLVVYDWPRWSIDGWDWVQQRISVVPELPGM